MSIDFRRPLFVLQEQPGEQYIASASDDCLRLQLDGLERVLNVHAPYAVTSMS